MPLWVNALGTVQKADNSELIWDTARFIPALASVDGGMTATLAGATYQGGAWASSSLTPGAFLAQGLNPWGETPGSEFSQWGLLSHDASGSFTLAGMLWMGARVYDPGTRGFLSLDPLPSPLGAAWGAHGYAFAGNDPVNLMDPWGLSPVSAQEMAEYQAANPTWIGAVKNWANENSTAIAIGAIALGVVGTALTFTGVGAPLGLALMAGSGALISGGASILTNKNPGGTVNWGAVGKDTLIGGASSLVGGGATMAVGKAVGGAFSAVGSRFVSAGSGMQRVGAGISKFSVEARQAGLNFLGIARTALPRTNVLMRGGSSLVARGGRMIDFGSQVASAQFRKMLGGQVVESSVTGASANVGNYVFNDEGRAVSAEGLVRAAGSGFGIGAVAPLMSRGVGAGTNQLMNHAPSYLNNNVTQFTSDFVASRTVDYGAGYANYFASETDSLEKKEADDAGLRSAIGGGSLDLGFKSGR